MQGIDILVYVEDPGAANYVSGLPSAFAKDGRTIGLLAGEFACPYLLERGVPAIRVGEPVTADDILSEWMPKLVIVGTSENPDTFGFELISASKRAGIPAVGVIDAAGNADYRFRGRSDHALYYAPDWLIVPDPWTRDAYVALGYPADKVAPCGHPHNDRLLDTRASFEKIGQKQLKKKIFPGCCEGKPVVVFVSEVSTGLNPDQYKRSSGYTLAGRGGSEDRTAIVLEEFLDAMEFLAERPYLVLRMHPKNTKEELAPFLKDFDCISQGGDPLELVFAADLVVGMTTMLLQEAAIMGTQTLSIVPRASETASLPTVRAGITPCVTTRETIGNILPVLLGGRETAAKTKAAMEELFRYGSTERVRQFINDLLVGNKY